MNAENLKKVVWFFHTILESLPISSSGHLNLFIKILKKFSFLNKNFEISEKESHLMHIFPATAITIFLIYIFFINGYIKEINLKIFISSVIISDLITGITYLIIQKYKINCDIQTLGFAITLLTLFSLFFVKYKNHELNINKAIFIGIAQSLSLFPGISRLAITFVSGCWLELSPKASIIYAISIELPLLILAILKTFIISPIRISNIILNLTGSLIALICLFGVYFLCINQTIKYFAFYMLIPLILSIAI